MYPSSSSSQKPMGQTGLTRYGSAPGSFLQNAVDSVIGANPNLAGHYYSSTSTAADSSSLTSESTCKVSSSNDPHDPKSATPHHHHHQQQQQHHLHGSYTAPSSSSSLLRQRSSPAGFLNQLTSENGFSVTMGNRNYSSQGNANGHGVSRLKSQLSFTRQDSLSQISEVSENLVDGVTSNSNHQNAAHSFAASGFGMDSWDNTNSIVFSAPPNKRAKNIDGDIYSFNGLETQYSLPQTTLEMATVEQLLHIPEDSVPCKIRAKRGCATHPRSIAERNGTFDIIGHDPVRKRTYYCRFDHINNGLERRTRISGKLKKLQDLVPNMDKQTSYSDMLDLAAQHIKGLQNEVQKLHKELETCTCGCKQSS